MERDERFFDTDQIQLREQIKHLIKEDDICAMKLSTEDAGMPFEDIRERHRLFGDLLPIQLKIGGPEARNDMRMAVKIGCRSLIAPMIESPYALQNFVTATHETLGDRTADFIDLQINIETRKGTEDIDNILDTSAAGQIAQITIGRHDLCCSLNKKPNHPDVTEAVKKVVESARSYGISVSIGGRITPNDAAMLTREIRPDKINTREVGFNVKDPDHSRDIVKKLLEFEIDLLKHERELYRSEDNRISRRIEKLKGRQGR